MNSFRVATYNLRYANNKDTGNLWIDRAPVVIHLIRFHDFDILGTQEGIKTQLDDLQAPLAYFKRFGVGRDDGEQAGEHAAIFFRSEKFSLLQGGTFWLSQTPDQPGFGWDARHNRICTWVKLEIKETGNQLFVFNAHFDHYGVQARNASSRLVLQKIKEIAADGHCILMGDFNDDQVTECYKILAGSDLLSDAAKLAAHPYINSPSFNSWGNESAENRHIDHIFVSAGFAVKKYGVLTDRYFSKTPSDHFPVMADLSLQPGLALQQPGNAHQDLQTPG